MLSFAGGVIILNNLALCVTIAFLVLLLWYDARQPAIQSFGFFLLGYLIWNFGSLLSQINLYLSGSSGLINVAALLTEVGFVGAVVGIYNFVTVSAGISRLQLRYIAIISVFIIFSYRLYLIVAGVIPRVGIRDQTFPYIFAIYALFSVASLYTIWLYRGKINSRGLFIGTIVFIISQGFQFANVGFSSQLLLTGWSSTAVLALGLSMLRREIIVPFSERNYQIETLQEVSVAISSQISIETLLNEIARQAIDWLDADGIALFLHRESMPNVLRIATVYNLPKQLIGMEVELGQGVAGNAGLTKQTILLENYQRDWTGGEDFPLAKQTLGSVVAVPLTFAANVIGVLMVVAGRHSRRFGTHDAFLLELLAAQAAVAISHSHLFDQIVEAREQLEAVLSSTENPVIAVDQQRHIIFANLAARSLFRSQGVDFSGGSSWMSFLENWEKWWLSQSKQVTGSYEAQIGDRFFLCHVGVLGGRKVEGWVIIFNDITELKELDRLKSEMVRMASHDLKNPLMGAMAHLDLLREDLNSDEQVQLSESVNTIERQLVRMDRIIRGVLDVERLKDVVKRDEQINVNQMINSAVSELNEFILEHQAQVQVDVEEDLRFWGNSDQFERALINLIENAIKFTLQDGQIIIAAKKDPDEHFITILVKDNGVGIPKALQSRIFDRFFRGEQDGVKHVTGSGLGLNLVKSIVEQHQGEIWLESEENRGTTFWIRVPMNRISRPYVSHSQESK